MVAEEGGAFQIFLRLLFVQFLRAPGGGTHGAKPGAGGRRRRRRRKGGLGPTGAAPRWGGDRTPAPKLPPPCSRELDA